jgi:hypothetical protein
MKRKGRLGNGGQDGSKRKTHPLELKLQVLQEWKAGTGIKDEAPLVALAFNVMMVAGAIVSVVLTVPAGRKQSG